MGGYRGRNPSRNGFVVVEKQEYHAAFMSSDKNVCLVRAESIASLQFDLLSFSVWHYQEANSECGKCLISVFDIITQPNVPSLHVSELCSCCRLQGRSWCEQANQKAKKISHAACRKFTPSPLQHSFYHLKFSGVKTQHIP